MEEKTPILNHQQIMQKVNRIAYQIYEDHYDDKEIIIAGIANNGFTFAQMLQKKLESISSIQIKMIELHIDKKKPIGNEPEIGISEKDLKNKSVILVDDVLNSGRTMMYGLQCFLKAPLKRLATVVLVNRSHKRFPVNANYVGVSLATTLKEHIKVDFEKANNYVAYLQ